MALVINNNHPYGSFATILNNYIFSINRYVNPTLL